MRCLFCKVDASTSRSREHIVPESLGNTKYILPPGVVCDRCNNYFSREVERPFLESAAITLLRFHESVPSKRGVVPPVFGMLMPHFPAVFWKEPKDSFAGHVGLGPDAVRHVLASGSARIILPASGPPPNDRVVSRFLAKVGLEAMAGKLVDHPEGLEYLATEPQLDMVRDHARRGTTPDWPFSVRRIYDADRKWTEELGTATQIVHEFDFLQTETSEWYFVLAIFGLELVLNMGGPEMEGYRQWLKRNSDASPLYWGKNAI
jgi:hypothetical protein